MSIMDGVVVHGRRVVSGSVGRYPPSQSGITIARTRSVSTSQLPPALLHQTRSTAGDLSRRQHRKITTPRIHGDDSYWCSRGWFRIGNVLYGDYRNGWDSYRGEIEITGFISRAFKFYIFSPPYHFLEGRHSACFHRRGIDKYWIHFMRKPRTIDDGILYIESQL